MLPAPYIAQYLCRLSFVPISIREPQLVCDFFLMLVVAMNVLLRTLEAGMTHLELYFHGGSSLPVQRRCVVVPQAVGAELGI